LMQKVLSNPKVKGITNIELLEIKGDKFVTALVYKDKNTGETVELPVSGIFVEIGSNPSVEFIKNGLVKLDDKEQIIVDPKNQKPKPWVSGPLATARTVFINKTISPWATPSKPWKIFTNS